LAQNIAIEFYDEQLSKTRYYVVEIQTPENTEINLARRSGMMDWMYIFTHEKCVLE